MTKEWMEVKAEIERLYLTQRLQLEAVQRIMLEQHGFHVSYVFSNLPQKAES